MGLPAVFVPLPHAVDDHQTANARYLADANAAFLIPQSELTPTRLADLLTQLDRQQCLDMATKGRQQANPDAASHAADIVWAASA